MIREIFDRYETFGQVKFAINESRQISERDFYSNLRRNGPSCFELVEAVKTNDLEEA